MRFIFSFILFALCFGANAQGYKSFLAKAEEAFKAKNNEDAIAQCEKALQFAEIDHGKESKEYAEAVNQLATYEFYEYKLNEAIEHFTTAALLRKKLLGEKDTSYISTYAATGAVLFALGDYTAAKSIHTEVLTMRAKAIGKNNVPYAIDLANLGNIEMQLAEYDVAALHLAEARTLLEKLKESESAMYANLLITEGDLDYYLGRYPEAIVRYERAMKIYKRIEGNKGENYARAMQTMGITCKETGQFTKGVELVKESHEIYYEVKGDSSYDYAISLNNLGNMYDKMGNYIPAEKYYRQAIALKKTLLAENSIEILTTQNNLALMMHETGKSDEAEELMLKAYNAIIPQRHNQPIQTANFMNNLATIYSDRQKYDEAEKLLFEALQVYKEYLGESSTDYSRVLSNIGVMYVDKGQFDNGIKYLNLSLQIDSLNDYQDYPDHLFTKWSLGFAYTELGKYKEALDIFLKALPLIKATYGRNHPTYGAYLYDIGLVYRKLKQFDKAKAYFKELSGSYFEFLQGYFMHLPESERQEVYHKTNVQGRAFIAFAMFDALAGDPAIAADVYNYRIASKSIMLNTNIKMRQAIYSTNNPALIEKYSKWKSEREYLAKLYSLTQAEIIYMGINVDSVEKAAIALETEIASLSADFAQLNSKKIITWKDVQVALKEGEAAVEILRVADYGMGSRDTANYRIKYFALIVTHNCQHPIAVEIDDARAIEGELIDEYNYSIQRKEVEITSTYIALWKRLADELTNLGVKRLYLSADGVYQLINPNVFLNPVTQRYVIEELDVVNVMNTRNIVNLNKNNSTVVKTAEFFGNPNYYLNLETLKKEAPAQEEIFAYGFTPSKQRGDAMTFYADLPGTKKEVEDISSILKNNGWKTNTWLQNDATESRLKQVQSPGILHIATHGYFYYDEDIADEGYTRINKNAIGVNPSLRAGLLMAGANYSFKSDSTTATNFAKHEDGMFTAYEAANLNLQNTDLVVLSACNSSMSTTTVADLEGYQGMIGSFMLAGAKTMLVSNWSVDDEATQVLMTTFFTNYAQTNNKHEAFRAAQIAVREKFSAPYYWGAFVIIEE